MKTLATILFLFFTTILQAQKVRLENDNSRYLCLNYSIAENFEQKLLMGKVDSSISILYDYDNGRLPNSRRIVIWTHNGTSRIRIVEGCDKIFTDTIYTSELAELWQYIKTTHFDDVTVPIKSGTSRSHDNFYHITITTPAKSFFIVVRDNERKKSEKNKSPESDTRVMLANKIDALLN